MVRLAIDGQPGVLRQRHRGGPGRAVVHGRHARRAAATCGIVDPWFILSAEALAGFPEWQEPDRILASAGWRSSRGPGSRPWTPAGSPPGSRARPSASRSSPGPCCLSRVAWCDDGPPPGARCAIWCPTPSPPYSPTTRLYHGTRHEDRSHVTEPAPAHPRPDGLPARETAGPGRRSPAARPRAADRRARGGQEGGRHRPAGPRRAHDPGRCVRDLLGRVGAPDQRDRRRHRRRASATRASARSAARARPSRTGSCWTTAR